jgi:hypothetical protein
MLGVHLPDELLYILTATGGATGFVGQSYISFVNGEELLGWRQQVDEWAPGFLPFGTNLGGEYYGLDSRSESPAYVILPAIGMEWGDAKFLGASWEEFWETLERGDLFVREYCGPPQIRTHSK